MKDGQNPDQSPYDNLPAAAATYAVGGMATHWTAAVPREHPEVERSTLFTNETWERLYEESEKLLKKNSMLFEHSIRNQLVKEVLNETYDEELIKSGTDPKYFPRNLPLAGVRKKKEFVTWTGCNTILGEALVKDIKSENTSKIELKVCECCDHQFLISKIIHKNTNNFCLPYYVQPMWQCEKVILSDDGKSIQYAVVKDLLEKERYHINAKVFVLAAGAVLTPQILYNSEIQPEALGHYLCEQPMAFCQIVLKQELVDRIPQHEEWKEQIQLYKDNNPEDPIPIPLDDPEPQVYLTC